ncbi:MAG: hypothetical protein ABI759_15065 [Candidatus Solibacter sp.]
MPQKFTNEIIDAAIEGFEGQKRRIDEQISELRSMRTRSTEPAAPEVPRPRRKMSASGRKAIAAAQRKRWAAKKGGESVPPKKAVTPKRKLSAAGRANIVAALKTRWAAKKAAAKK